MRGENYFYHTIRIITGIFFIVVFFSKFGFLPSAVNMPFMFTPEGWAFISAINSIKYIFPFIGIVSLVCGIAFLTNRYVALAAVLLMPITINFALFHIFLGFPVQSIFSFYFIRESVAYVVLGLNMYMLYSERKKYSQLFKI